MVSITAIKYIPKTSNNKSKHRNIMKSSNATRTDTSMKTPTTKLVAKPQTSVFPQTLHELRPDQEKPMPNPKPKKRDNIFSKSVTCARIAAPAK